MLSFIDIFESQLQHLSKKFFKKRHNLCESLKTLKIYIEENEMGENIIRKLNKFLEFVRNQF